MKSGVFAIMKKSEFEERKRKTILAAAALAVCEQATNDVDYEIRLCIARRYQSEVQLPINFIEFVRGKIKSSDLKWE